jgi:nucleoside-diphosphate-sugar epimerase
MEMPPRALLIVGCGYTGTRLASRARADGIICRCISGRHASAEALSAAGFDAFAIDLDADVLPAFSLPSADGTVIVYLAPPPRAGDRDSRIERFLAALECHSPAGIVYVSTTGVYGDRGGAPTDETTPPNPQTGRARRRLAAERCIREWAEARACGWVVLRVPGIYGPGRLPIAALREGVPLVREEEAGPGNRIHVDDLAAVCLRAASLPMRSGIYNVGDGCHWTRTEFLACVARAAGLAQPQRLPLAEVKARVSAMAWSFIAESRRIDTRKMRDTFGVRLRYPDPAAGIAASLAEMRGEKDPGQG